VGAVSFTAGSVIVVPPAPAPSPVYKGWLSDPLLYLFTIRYWQIFSLSALKPYISPRRIHIELEDSTYRHGKAKASQWKKLH
jgi:hypothetical protein